MFKIGDAVVGNYKANKYGITKENWIGKIIDIDDNCIFVIGDGIFSGTWVYKNYFDLKRTLSSAEMLFMED